MPSTPTEEGGYHHNASTLLEHWKKCGAAKVPAEGCGEEELSCIGVTPLVLAGREVLWFETSLVVTRGVWVRTALILMLKVEDECMMKRTRMVEMTSSHSRGPTFFWITLHSMLQWSFGVEGGRERERERERAGTILMDMAWEPKLRGVFERRVGATTLNLLLLLPLLAQRMRKLQRTSDLGLYGKLGLLSHGRSVELVVELPPSSSTLVSLPKLGRVTIAEHCLLWTRPRHLPQNS
ncbi:hypothetical protein GW17_00007078 [Ensete ventricosum]|nr:hypothetical protein GW17_00007078 [Ensete ventricosum]